MVHFVGGKLMNFGDWVRTERQQQGYLAQDLAKKLGIVAPKLSRIEHGKANATFSVVIPICEALGVDLNSLLIALSEGQYEPPPKPAPPPQEPFCLTEGLAIRFLDVCFPLSNNNSVPFQLLATLWRDAEAM